MANCVYCRADLPTKGRSMTFCNRECEGAWKFLNPGASYGISPELAESIMSRQDYIDRAIEGDTDAMNYLRQTFRLKSIFDPISRKEIKLRAVPICE